jgi:hypothetical protein
MLEVGSAADKPIAIGAKTRFRNGDGAGVGYGGEDVRDDIPEDVTTDGEDGADDAKA